MCSRELPRLIMPYVEYDEVEAICSDCGRIFRSEDALALHRTESHEGTDPPPPSPAPSDFRCERCHRSFATKSGLSKHLARVHPG